MYDSNFSFLKSYLNTEIENEIKAIKKLFYIDKEITNEIRSSLENLLLEINKCDSKDQLVQLVNGKIIKVLQKNVTIPQNNQMKTTSSERQSNSVIQTEIQFSTKQLEINYKDEKQRNLDNDPKAKQQKENSNYEREQKKKELIEKLKKQHTIIKEIQCDTIWETWKQIDIAFGGKQFNFFIPNKMVKINDYLNTEEYDDRRKRSSSSNSLCKLLNFIREYMKEWWVDIDKDYHDQNIQYNDHIRHSDSEAWKIAAEIMELDWVYIINTENDNREIEFNEKLQRTEAYTLISFKNYFHLHRFRTNGQYKEVERNVLMELK